MTVEITDCAQSPSFNWMKKVHSLGLLIKVGRSWIMEKHSIIKEHYPVERRSFLNIKLPQMMIIVLVNKISNLFFGHSSKKPVDEIV